MASPSSTGTILRIFACARPPRINRGNAAGKANKMATLTEFPDRELLGEDVIWCEAPESVAGGGFFSSHRILSAATHAGGAFGPATGKRVAFRTIADTYCRENHVWHEWLIRDNDAIAVQLGTTAQYTAQYAIDTGAHITPLTLERDEVGPRKGRGNSSSWAVKHVEML